MTGFFYSNGKKKVDSENTDHGIRYDKDHGVFTYSAKSIDDYFFGYI